MVDGNAAYFMNFDGEVCSYNVSSKKWSILPKCPYTNKLLSLPGYKEIFPAMPTKRRDATAVTSKGHLIVAGGAIGVLDVDMLNIVEVMDTKTLVWSTVASLPHPYSEASGGICGNQLYMLGGWDDQGKTKSVLTCSLTELLLQSSSSSSIWHRVADAPAYHSTCAAVNGELLVVGGLYEHWKSSSAICKYNRTTNSWNLISNVPTARYYSLIAVLPTNEMIVFGGSTVLLGDGIEIANFS